MSMNQLSVLSLLDIMDDLPAGQNEACHELADHIRLAVELAGTPVGQLALSLVAAEVAAREEIKK